MNYEKLFWWIFWIAFAIIVLLLFYGVALAIFSSTPIELTYILGVVAFGLLANKLIFGYGWVANLLDKVISQEKIEEENIKSVRDRLDKKNIQTMEITKYLSFTTLILAVLKDLDYYRYAYYGIFLLVGLLMILTKLNLLGNLIVGKYMEGLFWGAATTTFFVWGLEQLAKISLSEFLALELEKFKSEQFVPPQEPQPQENTKETTV